MEVGSFIELQFNKGEEYFKGHIDIARLNSGRAAIWHAMRVLNCNSIWIPYYQCKSVRDFLLQHGVDVKYYNIDFEFNPVNLFPEQKDAVLLVNYFGIMSRQRMQSLAENYNNVIIDNSQAFFCKPLFDCLNVYSARKFIGVPDGAYVLGKNAHLFTNEYPKGYSSDTSLFLLQRIEYGCEGKTYQSRSINENRLDKENVMRMSELTRTILDGTNYDYIIGKRRKNYLYASKVFDQMNCIKPMKYSDNDCVPMVYPLVIEEDDALEVLLENKHFQGHWWGYIMDELPKTSFEYWISKYIIPITIDQRYDDTIIDHIYSIIMNR